MLAVAVRLAFLDLMPQTTYSLLYPAVIAAGWIAGPWLILAATALGALATVYFLFDPPFSLAMQVTDVLPTIVFLATGVALAWIQLSYGEYVRRAEQDKAARTNQVQWAFAVDAGRLGLWRWDLPSRMTTLSPPYRRMLGYEAVTDFVAPDRDFFEQMHPDDVAGLQAAVALHLEGKAPSYQHEFRVRHRDGHYIWVESRGLVVERGAQGEPVVMFGAQVDVTSRHAQTLETQQTRDQLECALRSMMEAVVIVDRNGQIIQCNDAFVAFSRCKTRADLPATLAEYSGQITCFDTDGSPLAGDDWPVARALRGATGIDERLQMQRLDTGEQWVANCSYAPLRSPDAAVWGAVVSCRDVTEQLSLARAVQAANEKVRHAYEMQSIALEAGELGAWEWSLPERVMTGTDQCRLLYGLPRDSAYMPHILAAIHPDDRARITAALEGAVETRNQVNEEYRVVWPDGSVHWLHLAGRAIHEGGEPVRVAGVLGQLRGAESRMLADGIQQMMWISDDSSVIYLNEQWLNYCGGQLESHLNHGWIKAVHPDDRDAVLNAARATRAPGATVLEHKYRLRRNDGVYRWCLARGKRLKLPSEANALWYGTTIDVHDLHLALDEAQGANRAKAAFLATTSHELRTPLNAIIGFSTLLINGEMGPLQDSQTRPLEVIQRSSQQLLALVQDVLDFTAIEAGNLKIDGRPTPLAELLGGVRDQMTPLAAKRGLQLPPVDCSVDVRVQADPARLGQAVRNLVANGLNYTDEGFVRISATVDGNFVRIDVTDSGIGIPASEAPKIFQEFQPIQRGDGRIREGTGLGLAITRRTVAAMGGQTGFASEPGVGSRFWIMMPLAA